MALSKKNWLKKILGAVEKSAADPGSGCGCTRTEGAEKVVGRKPRRPKQDEVGCSDVLGGRASDDTQFCADFIKNGAPKSQRRQALPEPRGKSKPSMRDLTSDQGAALSDYATWAGKNWKAKLNTDWMRAGTEWDSNRYYLLQQIRNTLGPRWLDAVDLDLKEATAMEPKKAPARRVAAAPRLASARAVSARRKHRAYAPGSMGGAAMQQLLLEQGKKPAPQAPGKPQPKKEEKKPGKVKQFFKKLLSIPEGEDPYVIKAGNSQRKEVFSTSPRTARPFIAPTNKAVFPEAGEKLLAEQQLQLLKYSVEEWSRWYATVEDRANLLGADLQGANLQRADLQGANLQRANLQRANLQRAYLQGAKLQRADLRGADLQGADLQGANLWDAKLQRANLQGADLQDADLQDADLQGAKLQGAYLQHASLQSANLQGAKLQSAKLRGAYLWDVKHDKNTQWPEGYTPPARSASMKSARRKEAIQETTMKPRRTARPFIAPTNTVLPQAGEKLPPQQQVQLLKYSVEEWNRWYTTVDEGAKLPGADLQGADLQGADLQGANLQYADLQRADLQSAKLRGADLQDAKLQDAKLQGANLQYADLQRADLQSAKLRGADLQDAKLQGAYLQDAKLQDAKLQGANLQYANLQGADLQDAKLQGAYLRGAEYDGKTTFSKGFDPEEEGMLLVSESPSHEASAKPLHNANNRKNIMQNRTASTIRVTAPVRASIARAGSFVFKGWLYTADAEKTQGKEPHRPDDSDAAPFIEDTYDSRSSENPPAVEDLTFAKGKKPGKGLPGDEAAAPFVEDTPQSYASEKPKPVKARYHTRRDLSARR